MRGGMNETVERAGMQVDSALSAFIENDVLAPLGRDAARFWDGFAALCDRFAPRNRELLAKRDSLRRRSMPGIATGGESYTIQ